MLFRIHSIKRHDFCFIISSFLYLLALPSPSLPSFLGQQLLMTKVQVLRFRRALMDQRLDPYFPSDNTGAKVAVYEALDGWRGTLDEVNAHEEKLVAKKKAKAKAKKEKKYRTYSIYESDLDDFRGSYEAVVAHEKELKQQQAKPIEPHHDRVLIRIYEAEV